MFGIANHQNEETVDLFDAEPKMAVLPLKEKPLYDFQTDALVRLLMRMESGIKRIVLKMPCGGGKTRMAGALIEKFLEAGKSVAFCVNAISLVEQTVLRFREYGIKNIGVIQANHALTDYKKKLQICSVQTLAHRFTPNVDIVIIDEVHSVFKVYTDWIISEPNKHFIGLSATPYARGLGKMFQECVVGCKTSDLIEKKFLSPFRVFAPTHPDLKGVRVIAGDYHEGDLAMVMNQNKIVADVVETWMRHGESRPTFSYGVDRAHARHIQQQFIRAGVPWGYIDANDDIPARKIQFRQLRSGEIKGISSIGCLTTGIDEPHVSCIILARPTKSEILYQQIIGRGLRTFGGKSDCIIFDHTDTTLNLGFVTDIDAAFDGLDDGKHKLTGKKKEKEAPLPKECPQCHFLKPAKVRICPACGFAPTRQTDIEHEEGELSEVDAQKRKKKKNLEWTADQKIKFYGELKFYCEQKNFKPGWAAMKYKERLGVWPNEYRDAPPIDPSYETLGWIRHEFIKWVKSKEKEKAVAV